MQKSGNTDWNINFSQKAYNGLKEFVVTRSIPNEYVEEEFTFSDKEAALSLVKKWLA